MNQRLNRTIGTMVVAEVTDPARLTIRVVSTLRLSPVVVVSPQSRRPGLLDSEIAVVGVAMHGFFRDLRVGWRLLWRANPITWPALLSFVSGIGVNLTILRVAENLFYVPIPDRDRVVLAWSKNQHSGANRVPASWREFRYWKRESSSFEKLAAYEARPFTLGVQPRRRANGAVVEGEYFTLTGARPALGSAIDPSAWPMFRTAVISYRLWQRQWGGDKGVLGSALILDGTPFTVAGVLSADYEVLPEVDFWIQAEPKAGQKGSLWVLGKLRPGLSIEQARQEMETVASAYAEEASDNTAPRGAILSPVSIGVFDEDFRFIIMAVACAAVAVLVVASLNISGLLLTAALGRGRELAIRQAFGVSSWRIVRQLVSESVPLGLLSAAFSGLGSYWAGRIVFGLLPIAGSRQAPENFLATIGCALALALVAVPAWWVTPGACTRHSTQWRKSMCPMPCARSRQSPSSSMAAADIKESWSRSPGSSRDLTVTFSSLI